ncbi:MAG TPA: VWA domain-containing protein [Vicinamibacterales bacterium]|jgi:VWFA-related protein|nr:VWA domain-containing protein [Vicinamibacterales bacterium]
MKLKTRGLWSTVWLAMLSAGLVAQQPASPQTPEPAAEQPTFRVQIDLVTTDVIPRDQNGNFLSDLSKDEFEIYEDGVKQEITSMTVSHGGRVRNVLAPPPPVLASEGLILPPPRAVNDVSGRIFVFFVDDLHLQFGSTPRVRELFKKISKQLIHDGDLFGIVSSGPSSISVQMTYDKRRLDEAINKMTGAELKPEEIIEQGGLITGAPSEVKYRVGVAFKTVYELLQNLDKVRDRRKALIYVSDGYDLNPFEASRIGLMDPSSPFLQNTLQRELNQQYKYQGEDRPQDPTLTHPRAAAEFSDADLTMMLAELTREANRSNVTMYTIDPRGLVGPLSDLDQEVEPVQWQEFVRKSQDSLRTLAEETGGIAVVNQNDFDKALARIDAETSDYYVLGYYSGNPDPTQRRRRLEVRVTRPNVDVWSRKEYVLRTVPVANTEPAATPAK